MKFIVMPSIIILTIVIGNLWYIHRWRIGGRK